MLDKRKDYGAVHGNSKVKYYQDGNYYNHHEEQVTERGKVMKVQEKISPVSVMDQDVPDTVEKTDSPDLEDIAAVVKEKDFDAMSWREVREQVLAAGGVWTTKIEGINYLRGI